MKCKNCEAYGRDHISSLCVLKHKMCGPDHNSYCNRKAEKIHDELEEFLATDKRALYYILPNYKKKIIKTNNIINTMRNATKEERESVDNYIRSISTSTEVQFYDNPEEDSLVITFDHKSGDVPTLMVGRRVDNLLEIINIFTKTEALDLYYKLIGK